VVVRRRERPPVAKLAEAVERYAVFPHAGERASQAFAAVLLSALEPRAELASRMPAPEAYAVSVPVWEAEPLVFPRPVDPVSQMSAERGLSKHLFRASRNYQQLSSQR
jgi:hypothetical protein